MHRATAHNRGIFNAEVVQGLQVRDVREGGVSRIGKCSERTEVVQGLQVRDVREGVRQPTTEAFSMPRLCMASR